jgi:DNA replication licensing factor MCM6
MIRLSEALARLHCDEEIQPSYVREAYRLLKTSIIHVETADVDVGDDNDDDDDDDDNGDDHHDNNQNGNGTAEESAVERPGEYTPDESIPMPVKADHDESRRRKLRDLEAATLDEERPTKKSKKKKTVISFEEYESMANAIASHLRSLENDDDPATSQYLKWDEVVEWYLNQVEMDIGSSMEQFHETKKKVNLVIRRLLNKENVLTAVGSHPHSKEEEPTTLLSVHPNYVVP